MDDALKQKLAGYKKAKRERTRLLKDISPDELGVFIDMAEENGMRVFTDQMATPLAYVSRISPEQEEVLRRRLPWVPCMVRAYRAARETCLFSKDHLVRILTPAVTTPLTYIRGKKLGSIISWQVIDGEKYVRVVRDYCTEEHDKADRVCFIGLEGIGGELVRLSPYKHW